MPRRMPRHFCSLLYRGKAFAYLIEIGWTELPMRRM